MKRRHYRIYHAKRTKPMKRVRHREIRWDRVLLVIIGLIIIAAGGAAVWLWFKNGGSI